jgi:MinD-like ATPase involved in chromosome partitioning or flagellar assembly
MTEGSPPRFRLTGTTAGSGRTREQRLEEAADRTPEAQPGASEQPREAPAKPQETPPAPHAEPPPEAGPPPPRPERRPRANGRDPARIPESSRFRRGDVYTRPVVEGREVRDGTWSRWRERWRNLATSEGERREQALDEALQGAPRATRTNTIAVVSPKGGVGKTTCTFVVGNLLAEALNLRVVAVDANRDFGTLASLAPDDVRVNRSLADLLPHLDHIDSVSDVLAYVSQLPSGLHVMAAPEQAEVMAAMTPETYGDLLDLLGRFYEVIMLDLGTGIIDPLAQFGIRRADQALLVTTPEYVTADKVLGALRYLNAEAGWDSGGDEESLNRKRLSVVLNRAPSERSGDRQVIESAFRRFGIGRHVTIPYDDRLRVMLDSATYSLDELDRSVRLPVKRLGLDVVDRLI